ncbi:MAG: CotH kinase family protein [Flavobacteriales bacterium]|jgi:hypothetical protein|nr:CotH kinase family protein [Flavobacteriales bacterium]
MSTQRTSAALCTLLGSISLFAQVVINEGSSRNHRTLADENGQYHDWIELHNTSSQWVDLNGYSLSDDSTDATMWTFPSMGIAPNGYLVVFCSGLDRQPRAGQTTVAAILGYTPVAGWNTHAFGAPFTWNGTSNILIEVCAVNTSGNALNALMNQSTTTFRSTTWSYSDSAATACNAAVGNVSHHRPVIKLNGATIGTPDWQNNVVQYPAPYGNWARGSKHAMLFTAAELAAAGLGAGDLTSIAFDVVDPSGAYFDEVDIRIGHVNEMDVNAEFIPWYGAFEFHTNFGLRRGGESVFLFSPTQQMLSRLRVEEEYQDHSNGRWPDAANNDQLFDAPTPGATNSTSNPYSAYAETPVINTPSSISATPLSVTLSNPNVGTSSLRYTLDGSEPTTSSSLFVGPIPINASTVLRARAFAPGRLPSKVATASYLINPDHHSAILSISTNDADLNGPEGIFTRWWRDDEIPAHVDYFHTNGTLGFSQRSAMQLDGGFGGSRTQPQHSFRLELDNGTLGSGTVDLPLIPNRPARTSYSRIYLRNGSNQHLFLPHKDAAQVRMMAGETNSYYSAWTPVTVYINGHYFGLYELREKIDAEYFNTLEGADPDSMDLLTVSSWEGPSLTANEGSTNGFWEDVDAMHDMDPNSAGYWDELDQRFDLTWYVDYIIGQQWMGTTDWPINNIKLFRAATTGNRWRFCTTDLETAMAPNGQTDPSFNALIYSSSQDPEVPYTNIWQRSLANPRFHDHYINRFADVMNSAYLDDRIQEIAEEMFDLTRLDMADQLYRWRGTDTTTLLLAYEGFDQAFRNDLSLRTPVVRDDIQQFFSLPRQVDVVLNVFPAGAGSIRISTLHPDTYPWEGVYFDGVPVGITAEAAPGFAFHHWEQNGLIADTLQAAFLDTLVADLVHFNAHFEPVGNSVREVHDARFNLFPNPTTGELSLTTERAMAQAVQYRIVDLRGVLVMEGALPTQRLTLDVSGVAQGSYQLWLRAGDHREVHPFVKR